MAQTSESSSDESEPRESLVAGRAKRITAGNRLSHLLQHLDDEDIKADLLAEDEDDQQDYSASDVDGDVDMGSSSDDDDDDNDETSTLAGEKELKRQERQESNKKRKARDLVRIQPMSKRAKTSLIAPQPATASSGNDAHKPRTHKTVVERATALQMSDYGPVRQSARSQTMANAKVTEAKLKDHYKRAVKAQELMKLAAEKKAVDARPALTQADRMARALQIEQENSQSLNHWEFHEHERQRLQREKLEAMRNRKISGPFVRHWSGPVLWKWRQGPEGPVRETMSYKVEPPPAAIELVEESTEGNDRMIQPPTVTVTEDQEPKAGSMKTSFGDHDDIDAIRLPAQDGEDNRAGSERQLSTCPTGDMVFMPWPSMPPYIHVPSDAHDTERAEHEALINSLPEHRLKATRNLVVLENFDALDVMPKITTSRRATTTITAATAEINKILLPEAHPNMTADERRYLTARMKQPPKTRDSLVGTSAPPGARAYTRKADNPDLSLLPPPPSQPTCAISGKIARYRDPKTGLHYHDRQGWIGIWRALNGGAQWSILLGAWSGIVGEGLLGRVAAGVPEDFWTGRKSGSIVDKDAVTST